MEIITKENVESNMYSDPQNPLYGKSIEALGFSPRTYNLLRRSNIDTVAELCELTEEMLSSIKKLGALTMTEIQDKLVEHGLSLSPEGSGAERPWHSFQPYVALPENGNPSKRRTNHK